MKYQVLVKIIQDKEIKWLPVSPTNGTPYEFTKEKAEKYIETYTSSTPTYLGETMRLKEIDTPEYGKQYALTGKTGDKCIMNGNTWKESEIKS